MAARYAKDSFTITLASGAPLLVLKGTLRDSAHQAVTGAPSLFTTTPPVTGVDVTGVMAGYLQVHPSGPEC